MSSTSKQPSSHHIGALTFIAVTFAMMASAQAETLEGTLTDALTGYPVEDGEVRVLGTNLTTRTDAWGKWSFELPPGSYELSFSSEVGELRHDSRLVNQSVPQYKPAQAHVYTTWFVEQGIPALEAPTGAPTTSGALPADAPDTIQLPDPIGHNPLALTVTDPIPRRIRVGRRQRPESGCSNNPVIAIEEMDIDEYVKGVLPPEIGVFSRIPGASETYKAFGIAAKSYGLWFMLTYDESNRRNVDAPLPPNNYTWFHIDDTACNQRYSDERLPITTEAANAIANKILVKKGAPDTLDKLEYAASCGRHGTLPEYGSTSALVPDVPTVNSCAGSWCGHDNCAGHEDNPNLPGADRCLVRGMCQWGTISWGESGKDYLWMLSHYQPNLEIRDLQGTMPSNTVEVTGHVYDDPNDVTGSAIPGAMVMLSDGQQTVTNAQGLFLFNEVPIELGSITVTASAAGYMTNMQTKALEPGVKNWASIQLQKSGTNPGMGEDMGDASVDMGSTPPVDMGGSNPMQDMGSVTPSRDMSTGNDGTPSEENAEQFDEILTTSPGIDGGCQQAAHQPGGERTPGGVLLGLLGLLGVGIARRKRG